MNYICWLDALGISALSSVGGKNASLGEMTTALKAQGVQVPMGFATTAEAYFEFIEFNGLKEGIRRALSQLREKERSLEEVGKEIRHSILSGNFPEAFSKHLSDAYKKLSTLYRTSKADVAVRSSATAEDLPDASFAGQQESFLNVRGITAVLEACKKCFASLFTDRAIVYREVKGFDHLTIGLSVGVQKMVRADLAGSGVMFTLDMDSGFRDVIVIDAAWGLGENVVQGAILPDEYRLFKPLLDREGVMPIIEKTLGEKEKKLIYVKEGTKNISTPKKQRLAFVLSDQEILKLARWGQMIENHYQQPMDIEWAKDGQSGELFIVQARPETVQSRKSSDTFSSYTLKERGEKILEGLAIGETITTGRVQVIKSVSDIGRFLPGSILVTEMTSPDWVPIMKQAKGIITDHGGRTSHAAIVSRELGLPAIVGTHQGTELLKSEEEVTLSCAEGERGVVYRGALKFEKTEIPLQEIPRTKTAILLNISSPQEAMRWWHLPCQGIGLARMEFIINNVIKIHPMALIHLERVKEAKVRREIEKQTKGYADRSDYFVDHLSRGIAHIAASRYPHPVIVRMSDFKTNEYAHLIGGRDFEPKEENPMLGFRGASRYYNDKYREGFVLECRSIKRAREEIGLTNIIPMIPFCRTLEEADRVLQVLAENGLERLKGGLEVYVMCEIPSNVILAEAFADRFDGFSIGSNDLTQLVLGVDRDSEELAPLFDERNEAVKRMISMLIQSAKKKQCKVGICGQAPSDYPDFAAFLVQEGIDSISLNPDSVLSVIPHISSIERKTR
jgi:pyruvate, water dikinase